VESPGAPDSPAKPESKRAQANPQGDRKHDPQSRGVGFDFRSILRDGGLASERSPGVMHKRSDREYAEGHKQPREKESTRVHEFVPPLLLEFFSLPSHAIAVSRA
jgi:hypothetical protein